MFGIENCQYSDLQLLYVLIYQEKDLFIDFVMELLKLANQKDENNNFILVIINSLTKIVYDKPIKVAINIPKLP